MKKAIFIDRDGTLLCEPADEQIDALDKVVFVPGAISGLKALTGLIRKAPHTIRNWMLSSAPA